GDPARVGRGGLPHYRGGLRRDAGGVRGGPPAGRRGGGPGAGPVDHRGPVPARRRAPRDRGGRREPAVRGTVRHPGRRRTGGPGRLVRDRLTMRVTKGAMHVTEAHLRIRVGSEDAHYGTIAAG